MSAMAERWFPVLAAVLGLLGGIGGAAVGGYVANKGQEQRFKEERAARIRDVRIDAYVKFLRAAENEKSHNSRFEDSVLYTAEAEVELVARSAALQHAARKLVGKVFGPELRANHVKPYNDARVGFIQTGKQRASD
jgi:hypothetical protein